MTRLRYTWLRGVSMLLSSCCPRGEVGITTVQEFPTGQSYYCLGDYLSENVFLSFVTEEDEKII